MSGSTPDSTQPTVITLNDSNSIQILSQYIEIAQNKGAFVLSEAELLKRAVDTILNNVPDQQINAINGRQLLVQGIHKGQRHGAYTLNDASLLHKVVQYVENSIQTKLQPQPVPAPEQVSEPTVESAVEPTVEESELNDMDLSDDLSDLAEPIPLKPKEV